MGKVCFILVAGLDQQLLENNPNLKTLNQFSIRRALKPVTPAVTCTMQATITTGKLPQDHGIIANGLYTHGRAELLNSLDLTSFADFRRDVSFWEQSNDLLECPRFWWTTGKRVAMLFWQNSMNGAAEIVVTPKPEHSPDGKTFTACWTSPPDLYRELTAQLGPFPLQNYWGPMAGLPATQWIAKCAEMVWKKKLVDLEFVYIPLLDYNLQRFGPNHPAIAKDLLDLDATLAPLIQMVRAGGGQVIISGDYGISPVDHAVFPNQALRSAGLLATRPDDNGKLLVDYDQSTAFAMVDHQIAHVYCKTGRHPEVVKCLSSLPGVQRLLLLPNDFDEFGLGHGRSGDMVALAAANAWFAHDWWLDDAEKPAWQFSVDIHRKPGYDPREMFFDPVHKRIAQDAGLIKGSHGVVSANSKLWPVILCDAAAAPPDSIIGAADVAAWLMRLLEK